VLLYVFVIQDNHGKKTKRIVPRTFTQSHFINHDSRVSPGFRDCDSPAAYLATHKKVKTPLAIICTLKLQKPTTNIILLRIYNPQDKPSPRQLHPHPKNEVETTTPPTQAESKAKETIVR
jgi:hypothetical protein